MSKKGLTLVELLTVMAVIGLLMALVLSVMRACREQARSTVCRSHIRQCGFAFHSYCSENDTFPFGFKVSLVPPPGGQVGSLSMNRLGWWWFNYLEYYDRYFKGATVINCPSKRLSTDKLSGNVLCGNYGVNQSICKRAHDSSSQSEFVGEPLSPGKVVHPGSTLLLVDAGYALINWWHATDSPPQPLNPQLLEDTAYIPGLKVNEDREMWDGQEEDANEGRHADKTVNVGFVDAHVGPKRSSYFLVEKNGDDYRNVKPLWQPR